MREDVGEATHELTHSQTTTTTDSRHERTHAHFAYEAAAGWSAWSCRLVWVGSGAPETEEKKWHNTKIDRPSRLLLEGLAHFYSSWHHHHLDHHSQTYTETL